MGTLSNRHLTICDRKGQHGPSEYECLELSRHISVAVDFAKHGKSVPAEIFESKEFQVNSWPDFFEKVNHRYKPYKSTNVLG